MCCRNPGLPHDTFRDQDPTPRATNEPWRFTPSLLDPNSYAFAGFSSATGGYYTPTPNGSNTVYHPQSGDLQTPTLGLGIGLNTPLPLSTSETAMNNPGAMIDMNHFQAMQMGSFNGGFVSTAPPPPQGSFAPTTFVQHPDASFDSMDHDGLPINADERVGVMTGGFRGMPPVVDIDGRRQYNALNMAAPLPPGAEKFRFHATLNAPTAMIKHADEIPITYLNKGQAYSLSVIDTSATLPIEPGTRYRTFVRVSFEDEQQRRRPAACWSLWKEGRGTNEAHQRGGKLQAVEFIEARDTREGDDKRTKMELESSSFDGFSVIWTPGANGAAEVNIAVRFNFLSTDFSHSKGVKGIPIRLCAKTSPYPIDTSKPPPSDGSVEVCFCKAKLFRDHGAERKLSNDIAHVKKSIDKLKQQIAQVESGMKDFGKRKRTSTNNNKLDPQRPGKVQKHKRTWSMSSGSSANGSSKAPAEDDWHAKLQALQDMFTSTRPVSILFLRGEELDDPDLHPVALPGDPDFSRFEDRHSAAWQARSGRSSVASSSLVSPSTRSPSLASQVSGIGGRWSVDGSDGVRGVPDKPFLIKRPDHAGGNLGGWIEAVDVDSSYRPPPERDVKPVACFYILRRGQGAAQSKRKLYKAIYLMKRTESEFRTQIGAKWDLEPSRIQRMIRVLPSGVEVEIDDDVIREVDEGQDMIMEMTEVDNGAPLKTEWEMMVDTGDDDTGTSQHQIRQGYELRFLF